MVVGMYNRIVALLTAQQFDGNVGDHLVGVHIHRGAGTALDGVYDKLVVVLALHKKVTGLHNRAGNVSAQHTCICVCDGTGFFQLREAVDHFFVEHATGDGEVLHSPQGLNAIVGILGNLLCADGVGFKPESCRICYLCHEKKPP